MTGKVQMQDVWGYTVGGASLSFPWWDSLVVAVTGANQVLLALGGLILLGLTIYIQILKAQQLRRELKTSKEE